MTRWDDLDSEAKAKIDAMSREDMENHLREENPNSDIRQGLAGEYFEERFRAATGGLGTDDFNDMMAKEREEAEDDGPSEDDGEDEEDEPGTAHFEDEDTAVND